MGPENGPPAPIAGDDSQTDREKGSLMKRELTLSLSVKDHVLKSRLLRLPHEKIYTDQVNMSPERSAIIESMSNQLKTSSDKEKKTVDHNDDSKTTTSSSSCPASTTLPTSSTQRPEGVQLKMDPSQIMRDLHPQPVLQNSLSTSNLSLALLVILNPFGVTQLLGNTMAKSVKDLHTEVQNSTAELAVGKSCIGQAFSNACIGQAKGCGAVNGTVSNVCNDEVFSNACIDQAKDCGAVKGTVQQPKLATELPVATCTPTTAKAVKKPTRRSRDRKSVV